MNFVEAVRSLRNGECKGIKSPSLSSAVKGYDRTRDQFDNGALCNLSTYLYDDWELVGLVPQTEDVEVKRWAVIAPSGYCEVSYSSQDIANTKAKDMGTGYHAIELTGHYHRTKPQKVKKRKTITTTFEGSNFYLNGLYDIPKGARIFAEWEEEMNP